MNICGIVCEYNPFHNGHLYQLNEAKRRGADGIVCVMSGNFVQRGDFAIMQKSARAEAAVLNGADVVIELPLPWAVASAERFAFGAVSILSSLGVVTHLSFGAESDDTSMLLQAAKTLTGDEFNSALLREYSGGISYAKARELALAGFDENLARLITTPNNILAVEYLKAILRLGSDISPIAVARRGAAHDEGSASDGIASASFIRDSIENDGDFSSFLPERSLDIYIREKKNGNAPVLIKSADRAIMSVLKRISAEEFAKYGDVSEGLEYRLFDAVSKSTSLDEAISLAKTKRYAHSRIRRIFLNAFLGVKASAVCEPVPYARILAFSDRGRDIIKSAKSLAKIPIITRPSSIKAESEKAYNLLALERRADDIYSLFMDAPLPQGSTFTRSPVYVKRPD